MLTGQKKVLVVDDDHDIREIIMIILESEGYAVSGLDNGHAVIETIQQVRPDILLLDVQLGDMDGRVGIPGMLTRLFRGKLTSLRTGGMMQPML
ncbi:response regulator [Mucilaginibacter robiniae]|uniref:Response regulator n=1 Tax=Mucilaginibacter robiniae TaxID=2728022 RepID=A0A7L5DZP2_9SPHI|nr:response regulator [Mucilaginibacter robiniae]QJD95499.1 response regulator [Mucilaginibacter robiniae]